MLLHRTGMYRPADTLISISRFRSAGSSARYTVSTHDARMTHERRSLFLILPLLSRFRGFYGFSGGQQQVCTGEYRYARVCTTLLQSAGVCIVLRMRYSLHGKYTLPHGKYRARTLIDRLLIVY